jgi:hypothetical protein
LITSAFLGAVGQAKGMLIRTRLASASISLEACNPTKEYPIATRENLSFRLLPPDARDYLNLDTGEVFQDYQYARLHNKDKKLIAASITIRPMLDASDYQYNVMHYFEQTKSDDSYFLSQIYFSVSIEPSAFRELADKVKSGLFPEKITIQLDDPPLFTTTTEPKKNAPLEYGWEPDGSGMIWHNTEKENRSVTIRSVRFDYELLKTRYDEKQIDRALPAQANAPADRISEQTAMIRISVAEILKPLRLIAAVALFLSICVLAILFRQ